MGERLSWVLVCDFVLMAQNGKVLRGEATGRRAGSGMVHSVSMKHAWNLKMGVGQAGVNRCLVSGTVSVRWLAAVGVQRMAGEPLRSLGMRAREGHFLPESPTGLRGISGADDSGNGCTVGGVFVSAGGG